MNEANRATMSYVRMNERSEQGFSSYDKTNERSE